MLTVLDEPVPERGVLPAGLYAGEGDLRAERVAELGRAEPVELEAAVEVAAAADAGEGHRALAAGVVFAVRRGVHLVVKVGVVPSAAMRLGGRHQECRTCRGNRKVRKSFLFYFETGIFWKLLLVHFQAGGNGG